MFTKSINRQTIRDQNILIPQKSNFFIYRYKLYVLTRHTVITNAFLKSHACFAKMFVNNFQYFNSFMYIL